MFDCKEGPLLASLTMSVGQFLRLAAGQISPLYSLYSLHTFVFSVFSAHTELWRQRKIGPVPRSRKPNAISLHRKEKEERVVGIPVAWGWVAAAYDLAAGAAR